MLDAPLGADGHGHLVNACGVECCGEADGFGEFGCAVDGDAVKGLAPPVVCGNVEAGDGACLVDELRGLLFEGHLMDEIGGALLGGKLGVQECGGLCRLCGCEASGAAKGCQR